MKAGFISIRCFILAGYKCMLRVVYRAHLLYKQSYHTRLTLLRPPSMPMATFSTASESNGSISNEKSKGVSNEGTQSIATEKSKSTSNEASNNEGNEATSNEAKPGKALQHITSHSQYYAPPLDLSSLNPSPLEQFSSWFNEAQEYGIPEPEAVSIATVNTDTLQPSVRVVLLKQVDETGFVFFTNYKSRKGKELGLSPDLDTPHGKKAGAVWYWRDMHRSVRVTGRVERLSYKESEEYHSTRPIGSQIGAHASPQSCVVEGGGREELEELVQKYEDQFGIARGSATRKSGDPLDMNKKVPLPKYWGGVRIVPNEVEFWVGRENRWVIRSQ